MGIGSDSVTNIRLLRTGSVFSSPSVKFPATAFTRYVSNSKSSGTIIFHFTTVLWPASMVKSFSASWRLMAAFAGFCVIASKNSSWAVPLIRKPDKFTILVLKNRVSAWRRKRGALGTTISFLAAVNSFISIPELKSVVCARLMNFHLVNDSGSLKSITKSPFLLVFNSGKKNAVSLKSRRTWIPEKACFCSYFNSWSEGILENIGSSSTSVSPAAKVISAAIPGLGSAIRPSAILSFAAML